MRLFPPYEQTLLSAAADLAAGKRSCVDLLTDCLNIIDEKEESIRAWVSIDREGALASAEALDAELKAGDSRGPLHGIPVGIKDIVDVAGWPTAAGSELLARHVAATDAPVVKRLKKAGAVILGKTVTTQFASFDPPVTRNPWNLERTPGGSSSGSAAAVAAGMCLGAVGSQTGGSIARPAAFCGIAGLKPTYGKVPLDGILPLSTTLDHPGPLARTARDTAVLYAAMAGITDWGPLYQQTKFTPPQLGMLGGVFQERADAEMLAGLLHAMEQWLNHGAFMESITLPSQFEKVLPAHRLIMAKGAANHHRERFEEVPEDYQPAIRGLIEEGLKVSEHDWQEALAFQRSSEGWMLELFEEVDVLVTPASVGPAPDLSTTGDPVMNSPFSFCGFPTITFPMGIAEDGLPLGVQLIGKPDGERELYEAAIWCEDVIASQNPPHPAG